jgi:hypothetical protein
MSELLPCPLCGHLHPKPGTRTKFKCKNKACAIWLELSKDLTFLQDYVARKESTKATKDDWWHQQALIRQRKLGTDYDTARALVLAEHNANTKKMRDEAAFAKLFPQEKAPTAPKSQPYTNKTKPIVAMSTTSEDDTGAPF